MLKNFLRYLMTGSSWAGEEEFRVSFGTRSVECANATH